MCGRLHQELAVLREYRKLREEERRRGEERERRRAETRERARDVEDRGRRERERGDILAWRRNRIEVASLSRAQVRNGMDFIYVSLVYENSLLYFCSWRTSCGRSCARGRPER